jgi:hypothetical protein
MYRDPIRPVPSPMYDYLSIKPYTRTNETGLAIGNAREFNAVTADQLVFVATRAGASPKLVVTTADAMVDRFIDEWQRFRKRRLAGHPHGHRCAGVGRPAAARPTTLALAPRLSSKRTVRHPGDRRNAERNGHGPQIVRTAWG